MQSSSMLALEAQSNLVGGLAQEMTLNCRIAIGKEPGKAVLCQETCLRIKQGTIHSRPKSQVCVCVCTRAHVPKSGTWDIREGSLLTFLPHSFYQCSGNMRKIEGPFVSQERLGNRGHTRLSNIWSTYSLGIGEDGQEGLLLVGP